MPEAKASSVPRQRCGVSSLGDSARERVGDGHRDLVVELAGEALKLGRQPEDQGVVELLRQPAAAGAGAADGGVG
jgi:hypothetical protein